MAAVTLHNWLLKITNEKESYIPQVLVDSTGPSTGIITAGSWRSDAEMTNFLPLRKNPGTKSSQNAMVVQEEFQDYFYVEGTVRLVYTTKVFVGIYHGRNFTYCDTVGEF